MNWAPPTFAVRGDVGHVVEFTAPQPRSEHTATFTGNLHRHSRSLNHRQGCGTVARHLVVPQRHEPIVVS